MGAGTVLRLERDAWCQWPNDYEGKLQQNEFGPRPPQIYCAFIVDRGLTACLAARYTKPSIIRPNIFLDATKKDRPPLCLLYVLVGSPRVPSS